MKDERMSKKFLAFDLGAESGRGIIGTFDGSRLQLEVLYRFPNGPVTTLDTMHWDVLRLYQEMVHTLRLAAGQHGSLDSLGVDTWGVDFALLGRNNTLLGNPRHYRDPHTEGTMEQAFQVVSREEMFRQTGLQFMRFNSLFQLFAMKRDRSPLLDMAESLLMIPDLFHFFFTGIKANEFSDVSTSQMYDPTKKTWAYGLMEALGLPTKMLGTIIQPGTVLGPLRNSIVSETGINAMPVIAPATHDTAAAVAAVPAQTDSWAYISSGTWSLMGMELPSPLLTADTQRFNFTNEGGVGGTIRLLKNIMGLWLVQECRRVWDRQGHTYSYDELMRLASAAPPFASLVDPDDTSFYLPQSMPAAIGEFCKRTGQPVPTEPGPVIRCALESLALKYRWVMERLEELTKQRIRVIHIVGGGSQNTLLSQFTADACQRQVMAGPVEATAIGNVLVQAIGLGVLGNLHDARQVVMRSFAVQSYEPQQPEAWNAAYQRFLGHLPK